MPHSAHAGYPGAAPDVEDTQASALRTGIGFPELLLPMSYQRHVMRLRPDVTRLPSWLQDFVINEWEDTMPQDFPYIESHSKRSQDATNAVCNMCAVNEVDLVLYNLSKAEYVRGDAARKLRDADFRVRGVRRHIFVGLAHILGAYICWSSDHSCSMSSNRAVEDKLARGGWAGDRFEVTHKDAVHSDVAWEDTTDEAVAWLVKLGQA